MRIDESYLEKICISLNTKYPELLTKKYHRIMDKILTYWTTPDSLHQYFSSLIIDDRGDRAGFSQEVIAELLALQKIYEIWLRDVFHNPNFKIIDYEKEILAKQAKIDHQMILKLRTLNDAITNEDLDLIEAEIKNGFFINQKNEDGMTLMHISAMLGKEEITRFLLDNGGSINVFDNIGFSPMHWSVQNNRKEIFFMILQKHPYVNHLSKQNKTPLWLAVSKNYEFLVKQLLESRGNPNIADNVEGNTPLHKAVQNNNLFILNALLEAGGDIYMLNKKHESVLSMIQKTNNSEMIHMIEPYRKNSDADGEFTS